MHPFLNGLLVGFFFLFSIGPAFFALVQTSLQHGFKRAAFFAFGISISDLAFVVLILMGFGRMLQSNDIKFWLAIFGTCLLLGYAGYSWLKKPVLYQEEELTAVRDAEHLLKGFLMNGLNPFMIISWMTIITTVTVNFEYVVEEQRHFFAGVLVTILTLDIGKAFLANRFKSLLTVRFISLMNKLVAVVLFLFSLRLLYSLFSDFNM